MTFVGKFKAGSVTAYAPHGEGSGPRGRAAATFAARVTLEGVSKTFDEAGALKGVDLDISPGEIVCLLGPSGCGKTTLLRIIAGIERPTSGRVLINDLEVAGPSRFIAPERRNVGLMFQDFALFPHLDVLDNVAFGLRALPKAEAKRAALSILERVDMAEFAATFPSVLSGGQQQRVALARAIVPRPAVMLMDEPFSGLDVQLRDQMQEETLALLRETRATSIIVTHHPEEAMRMGDRIVILREGRVVQSGSAETLYRDPADLFVARLFSEINEIPGEVSGGRIATPAGTFPAPGLPDGTRAVVCLRERGLTVTAHGKSAGNGLAGRVLSSKFLGDVARLEVAVSGIDLPLKVRVAEKDALSKGTEVQVAVESGGALVFAAERAA